VARRIHCCPTHLLFGARDTKVTATEGRGIG
jgi:hypothetical protein